MSYMSGHCESAGDGRKPLHEWTRLSAGWVCNLVNPAIGVRVMDCVLLHHNLCPCCDTSTCLILHCSAFSLPQARTCSDPPTVHVPQTASQHTTVSLRTPSSPLPNPPQLPACQHNMCLYCLKGVRKNDPRCGLCRKPIESSFFDHAR